MISYIYFFSGKFAVLPTQHKALLATNSFLLVVLVIHYILVVWKLYTVALACMPVVMGR